MLNTLSRLLTYTSSSDKEKFNRWIENEYKKDADYAKYLYKNAKSHTEGNNIMKKLIDIIKNYFTNDPRTIEELYLSNATSLEDLERRQRQIIRNEAPWQTMGGRYI